MFHAPVRRPMGQNVHGPGTFEIYVTSEKHSLDIYGNQIYYFIHIGESLHLIYHSLVAAEAGG